MKRIKQKARIQPHRAKMISILHSVLILGIVAMVGFCLSSLYMAVSTGSGPFSSMLQKNSIMLIGEDYCETHGGKWNGTTCKYPSVAKTPTPTPAKAVDPCLEACKANSYACNGCRSQTANNQPTTVPASVILSSKVTCEKRSNSTQSCKYTTTCICKKISKEEEDQPVVAQAKTCNVRPGINIEVGKFAATGRGLDASGKVCTQNGCPARECVEIKSDCSHGPSTKCHEQNLAKPGSVILPTSSGPEYSIGMTQDQVKDAIAKGQKLPDKPKDQCYDKNSSGGWVIVTDGTRKSTDSTQACSDGNWKEVIVESDYALNLTKAEVDKIADRKSACEAGGKKYVGDDCITSSELDILLTNCQNDFLGILDITTGICIKNQEFTRPPENKLVSGDNCNTEQIIENQKVYIDCSTAFPTIKFCTGGNFDANHNCILPTAPVNPDIFPQSAITVPSNSVRNNSSQLSSSTVPISYFNQKNYGSESVSGGGSWSTAGCGVMAGAMVFSLVDDEADPYSYNQLLSKHGGVTSRGTGWFDQHKVILEENNFEVVPVYGSMADKQKQIKEYANEGVPVWINAYIDNGAGKWIGHHTLAVGIDQSTGDIILDDPYFGEGYHMPIERFDVDCSKSSCGNGTTGWVVNAIVPPEGTI